MIEDITATKTTDQLSDLLEGFCFTNGVRLASADELLIEMLAQPNPDSELTQWLQAFITQWEAVQAEEDFESAIYARREQ
jgi:hypothetical protein